MAARLTPARLSLPASVGAAAHSAAVSALSIIVPCLDEAPGIAAALEALQPLRLRGVELVVVDGGSRDDTVALATPLVDRVLQAPRGRASQMNAGAAAARGSVLLFLHADCTPPPDADAAIVDGFAASGRHWGRFDVRLAGRPPLLKAIAFMMNLRSRLTGIATGDQGIFVARREFEAVGGFASIALMEDIELSTRLKARGAPLCLRSHVRASGRRWEQHGVLRTLWLMWRLRLAYFCGADPGALAGRYDRARSPASTCIAVFAKAPEPGRSKTRLIPLLGAHGAAALQERLIERALATATTTGIGAVELWCTPSRDHPLLERAAARAGVERAQQCGGDLGARMLAAAQGALRRFARVIIVGTDCPALTPHRLHDAARALADNDAVVIPAEDGGYVLIGLRRCDARLFSDIAWGGHRVMAQTRERLTALGWRWRELPPSWDVDRPDDYLRLRASGLMAEVEQPDTLTRQEPRVYGS